MGLKELLGEEDMAEESLAYALRLGKEKGFYQIYLDEGREVSSVFCRLLKRKDSSYFLNNELGMKEYVLRICLGFQDDTFVSNTTLDKESLSSTMEYKGLVEELTPWELEILHLVSRGLSNLDISQKLFLSLPTIKWHYSNIFGKLEVNSHDLNRSQQGMKICDTGISTDY